MLRMILAAAVLLGTGAAMAAEEGPSRDGRDRMEALKAKAAAVESEAKALADRLRADAQALKEANRDQKRPQRPNAVRGPESTAQSMQERRQEELKKQPLPAPNAEAVRPPQPQRGEFRGFGRMGMGLGPRGGMGPGLRGPGGRGPAFGGPGMPQRGEMGRGREPGQPGMMRQPAAEQPQSREPVADVKPLPVERGPMQRIRHIRAAAENLRLAGMNGLAEQLMNMSNRMERQARQQMPRPRRAALEQNSSRELQALRQEVEQLRRELKQMKQELRGKLKPAKGKKGR